MSEKKNLKTAGLITGAFLAVTVAGFAANPNVNTAEQVLMPN